MNTVEVEFWYWLIFGVVFVVLEVFVPGAILMWFGFGAIVTGILLWVFPALGIGWQILCFALVSGVSVLAWRKSSFFRDESTPSDEPELNNRLNMHIGKEYALTEAIINGRGSIRVGDSAWKVTGADLPSGTRVRIVGLDGVIFKVEKAK